MSPGRREEARTRPSPWLKVRVGLFSRRRSSSPVTCIGFTILGYVPLLWQSKLPFTFSPEYIAANRAYMRYHNMNPIWGISSKQAREADAH
mmetsp:Transcript_3374/g.8731  ORF Transcript_3374/g.8731 Transcript_3374/m.8731 type:complete len:91 (+) Transcript_3374:101-373(+)